MPRIYRSMKVDGDKPLVENSANGLGVRIGNGPNDDIPITKSGEVIPGTGGMSVASNWSKLPFYRIPRRLRSKVPSARGSNLLACWQMGIGKFATGAVANGLHLRLDRETHGLVEPDERATIKKYLQNLASTRDEWAIDEE